MYDCFNMAYQDNANALQLHIKINSENLIPVPQKNNAGSLRIPADPSWPKIPQRKLIDDVDDTIEPPCIITLTGTPRRSRTIVQTPLNQSPKSTVTKDSAYSSFHHQKAASSLYSLKKFPGYTDPRFKKVTNIKRNQVTSTESLQKNDQSIITSTEGLNIKEMEKLTFEKEQIKIQEAQKSHEEKKTELIENHGENIKFIIDKELLLEQKSSKNNFESKKQDNISDGNENEIIEKNKYIKNLYSSEHISKLAVNDANTQVDITSLPVQENNGQLFFVLDKKLQSHALNAIHVDTITVPQECINQCYNVQLPVLTYQNIPMQVSSTGTNNVIQQCLNHLEHKNQTKTLPLMKKESEQHIHSNQAQNESKSLINNADEKSIYEEKNTTLIQNKILEENKKTCFKPDFSENLITSEKLPNLNIQHAQQESSDSEYYIPNINKKNTNNHVFQCLKMKKITYNTTCEETTDSEFVTKKFIQKKEFIDANEFTNKVNKINTDTIHDNIKTPVLNHDQVNHLSKENEYFQSVPQSNIIVNNQNQSLYQNYKANIYETRGRNKSEQYLPCIKNECTRKLCRNSEPYITFKQKKASARFSRKAKSYFQKNSHSALIDSDYTLVWPNCQYNKYKRNQTNIHKFGNHKTRKMSQHFNPVPVQEQNMCTQIDNVSNFIENNYLQNNKHIISRQDITKSLSKIYLQRERCKYETSPRSNIDDIFERSKRISPKTQELLNKSYWEYYNRLRHKIENTSSIEQQYPYNLTVGISEKGKQGKTNEVYGKELKNQLKINPELQTLQQCTALSTAINKALDSNLESNIMQTKQLYINDNIKANHKDGIQNSNTKKISHLNSNEPIVNKLRYNGNKNDKQFLELKSIIFFGGMMYILIIFLPMLYDYFYYEEYDDYENLSYLELVVEYILSSFQEAFGGIFNGVRQIFFYPHACKKCTNNA